MLALLLLFALGACTEWPSIPAEAIGKGEKYAWQPGDPIPGWEDFMCSTPIGANVVEWAYPTVEYERLSFYKDGDRVAVDLLEWLADCASFDCESGGVDPGSGQSPSQSAFVRADGIDLASRIQGSYDIDIEHEAGVGITGSTSLGRWYAGYCYSGSSEPCPNIAAGGEVCLSRVRPDQVIGQFVTYGSATVPMITAHYGQAIFVTHFQMDFPDHGGEELDAPDGTGTPPGPYLVEYAGLTYDEAWPWEQITDSSIRTQVYDRYLPWNEP